MLEFTLLGYLMYSNLTGYDLKQCINEFSSTGFDASFGGIYPALKRMLSKGFIISQEVVDAGKFKKIYSITEYGKSHFMSILNQPLHFSEDNRSSYILPIFFFDFLPRENAVKKLREFMLEVTKYKNNLKSKEMKSKEVCRLCQFSTLTLSMDYCDLLLNWCNKLINELENQ